MLELRYWRGSWVKWNHGLWSVTENAAVRAELYTALKDGCYLGKGDAHRPWSPTPKKIADVERAIKAITRLAQNGTEPGDWIGNPEEGTRRRAKSSSPSRTATY